MRTRAHVHMIMMSIMIIGHGVISCMRIT